jgi:hypothetical protein
MKKQYISYYAERMRCDIDYYFKMLKSYNRDLARANRIELELLTLSDDAVSAARDFTGINPRELIIELRSTKYVDKAIFDIARTWHNAPITKAQRALLGKDTMQQIKTIYQTL